MTKIKIVLLLFFALRLFADESMKLYDDSQVAVIKITADPEDIEWMLKEENWESDSFHLVKMSFSNAYIDTLIDSVGFRLRGNTSRHSRKKSFKLSINEFISGREFYGVDKLNLNGEHNDPSIIRSKLCWDLYQKIGMKASRAAYTALYINDVYYGLYASVEHVDDEFIKKNFKDDSGNLWKCLYPADLSLNGNGHPENYFPDDEGRPYELKTNEEENDYYQLARLIYIINRISPESRIDSLEKIIDMPSLLKYFSVNVLTGSWDDYWFLKNNYYLYHHPKEDKFYLIPYDYDNTFGIDWFNIDWANRNPYGFGSEESRPLAECIMEDDQYRNLFSHFLEFYNSRVFTLDIWESRIDSIKEMITPFAELDSFRTLDYGFTMDDFNLSYTVDTYANQHVYRGIKEFIRVRNSSLPEQLEWFVSAPVIYSISQFPETPSVADSIYIQAAIFSREDMKSAVIEYHDEKSDSVMIIPMSYSPLENTFIIEETDRWTGTIPPIGMNMKGYYKIIAENNSGLKGEYPRSDYIAIQTPGVPGREIVINEFLTKNSNVNTDEAGEYEDWIEIYNPTDEDLLIGGMFLTDDPDNLTKWQFPFGGTTIPAGGFLLIWCDEDEEQGALHCNFKLDKDGEFIGLVDTNGISIIDSITFGSQEEDISFGRYPDGNENWQSFPIPTPGAQNNSTGMKNIQKHEKLFILYKNYPNPFSLETKIDYQIGNSAYVELTVMNNLGQKAAVLVNKKQNPGFYSVVWDASRFSSGIYYYRLNAGKYSETRKMILIK